VLIPVKTIITHGSDFVTAWARSSIRSNHEPGMVEMRFAGNEVQNTAVGRKSWTTGGHRDRGQGELISRPWL
jgi:hypothetical protein